MRGMAKKKTAQKSVKKKSKRRPGRDLVADSITVGSIEAQQLTLVDEKGRPRLWAMWLEGKDRRGSMRLQFLDKEHRPLLELATLDETTQQGVFISLCTPEGRAAVSIGTTYGRGSGITVHDHEGASAIRLAVNHPENPQPPGPQPRIDVIDWQMRRGWANWDGQYQLPPA